MGLAASSRELETRFTELRLAAIIFSEREQADPAALRAAKEPVQEAIRPLASLPPGAQAAAAQAAISSIEGYIANLRSLEQLRLRRDAAVREGLLETGRRLRETLAQVREAAEGRGDAAMVDHAADSTELLMRLRMDLLRFADTAEAQLAEAGARLHGEFIRRMQPPLAPSVPQAAALRRDAEQLTQAIAAARESVTALDRLVSQTNRAAAEEAVRRLDTLT